MKLALVGKDVSLSPSPEIHEYIAKNSGRSITYEKFSVCAEDFGETVGRLLSDFDGFNVTIPYKLSVIERLASLEGDARIFGSVNTVRSSDKSGHNTDGAGFMLMLKNNGVEVGGGDVLVLGAGGAGRSVAKKLADAGARVEIFDRNRRSAVSVAEEFDGVYALNEVAPKKYGLIVNATGVGMHKSVGISPVQADIITLCDVAADLIYVPEKSAFLRIAENLGKKIINGAAMLFYQAYFSQCIWFGIQPDETHAKALFEKYLKEKDI